MLKRLPNTQAILQVYAVMAVMFSAWTIFAFLWKLVDWLMILNVGEIMTIFSYSMFTNLLEGLILLLILLALCALLPPHLLRDDFIVRGTIVSVGLIGALMTYLGLYMRLGMENAIPLFVGPIVIILLTAFLLGFSSKFHWLRSAATWLSDRLLIFLFILVPLYVIFSAYVIVRNIL